MENNEKVYSLSELKEAFDSNSITHAEDKTFQEFVLDEWGIDIDNIEDESSYSFTL